MTEDPELDAWRAQWQARGTVPPDLRRRVEREIRSQRYAPVLPVAVTVIFGGGTLTWAVVSGERHIVLLTAATWAFIAVTWMTSLALVRHVGRPGVPAPTTTAFLDFMIQVCRGRRAAIAAAAALYPIFFVMMLIWRYHAEPFASVGALLSSGRVLVPLFVTLVLAVVAMRTYRALGAELEHLRAMRKRFDEASR